MFLHLTQILLKILGIEEYFTVGQLEQLLLGQKRYLISHLKSGTLFQKILKR